MITSKAFTPNHFNIKKEFKVCTTSKSGAGFTILEAIMAIFVVTVGVVGIFITIQNYSRYVSSSADHLVASSLAQEGMEIIRNIRDTNWLEEEKNPDPDNPIPWDEGLLNICSGSDSSGGCEVDYIASTLEKPSLSPYQGRKLKINPNGFYQYDCSNPGCQETKFQRRIIINNLNDYTLEVKVLVYRNNEKIIKVSGKLYNWKQY